ncbi:flagellar protein FliT [Siminovitchia acidinfaciens]|uniref:Flagellar protein FliT n=1 Tax=Siminovitchia acidinfaciens TaxID=2321395 RepID=A0A429Y7V2_9BACI|nr:flagellar protein FliT [Siminovitchia acidinfaciens]RST77505.1 flagellar protein FliT [Siminovitchia acidinfaciens]
MSAVQECLTITRKLVDSLKSMEKDQREELIVQIEELLAQREELLPAIQPPFSAQEQAAGRELLKLNKELEFLLEKLNKNILRDLNAIDLKKTSAARYTNTYKQVHHDGVFYDKRQ